MTVFETLPETEPPPRPRPGSRPLRGRYAPSPSGRLHLGNASTALAAWLSARSRGGGFVMRVEDLDAPRVREGMTASILGDLAWLGLDWDEGPDVGGPHGPYEQSRRGGLYRDAFEQLASDGRVYPCFCSRKDIAGAASAPQAPGDETRYPGTCRDLDPGEAARRFRRNGPRAWRFRVNAGRATAFIDRVRGPWGADREPPGDFVVLRADGTAAYQLAVVVDDAAMGITEVVRGDDLLPSTVRQLLLFEALGLDPPAFGHVPLLLGPDGVRLSKRHRGVTVEELREAGLGADEIVGRLAWTLGLVPVPRPVRPGELADRFSLEDVVAAPEGIPVNPDGWLPPPA